MKLVRHGLSLLITAALLGGCAHVAPVGVTTAGEIAKRSTIDTLQVEAPGVAPAPLRVRVLLPPGYDAKAAIGYPVLYVNDGRTWRRSDCRPRSPRCMRRARFVR